MLVVLCAAGGRLQGGVSEGVAPVSGQLAGNEACAPCTEVVETGLLLVPSMEVGSCVARAAAAAKQRQQQHKQEQQQWRLDCALALLTSADCVVLYRSAQSGSRTRSMKAHTAQAGRLTTGSA
jgi:hypothetical protein